MPVTFKLAANGSSVVLHQFLEWLINRQFGKLKAFPLAS